MTVLVAGLLILHIAAIVKLDGIALALVAVALLPWVGPVVEELGVPGFVQLKLRRVESDVNTLQFIVASMMPRWELEILERLNAPEPFVLDTNQLDETWRRDLRDLWGRGFIRQKQPGVYFPRGQGNQDLKSFYDVDSLGHEYLDLRKRFLAPMSTKAPSA